MRIGLDLHLYDAIFQGSRTYALQVFTRVVGLCPSIEFVLLLDDVPGLLDEYPQFVRSNVHPHRMPTKGSIARLAHQIPVLQRKLGLDAMHMQYIAAVPSFCANFVTIHDVLFESHPEYFSRFFCWRSRLMMRRSARIAEHIFTVSEFSRSEIVKRYRVPNGKVSVTPNGADSSRFFPGDADRQLVVARGLVPGSYILSVGRLEPRKNHVALLKAYRALGPDAPPLVLAGQRDFGFGAIFDLLADPLLAAKVLVIENLSETELPALYRHCLFFAYPSLAEGFGMPPLEAMASGVPVISSRNTALTEVVADGGMLIDPENLDALQRGLQQLIHDDQLRNKLKTQGLIQAQKFAWDASAATVANAYMRLEKRFHAK